MVTNAKRIANKKYRAKTYDTIGFDVPKGKRDEFKAKAAKLGLSLSMLIQRGVESYGEPSASNLPEQTQQLTTEQKIFDDEFSKLPADIQKHFLKVFKAINDLQCSHLPK